MRAMITGGTGTFGNALLNRLLYSGDLFSEIVIFSRDENKQFYMKREFSHIKRVKFQIGDVRDEYALARAMKGVDIIFHAAALKHVPIGEEFPLEAIDTNIMGIRNILEVAESEGVNRVVNLSSDKAVYPVNAYGMTKGLSERIVAAHQGSTLAVSLRYGNVIGSRGSVIPLFIDQTRRNHPFTVTNRKMTRFLLSIEEAVSLAVRCSVDDVPSGSLFVVYSPACTIETLVEAISRTDYDKANIIEVGIRPGEKIHETLLTKEEVFRSKLIIGGDGIDYYIVPPTSSEFIGDFSESKEFTSENTVQRNSQEVYELLLNKGLFK